MLIDGYSKEQLLNIFIDYLNHCTSENDFNLELNGMYIVGSRVKKTNREDSDLDVLVIYSNPIKDYIMHEILNDEEDGLYIDGIKIDFIPYHRESNVKLLNPFVKLY